MRIIKLITLAGMLLITSLAYAQSVPKSRTFEVTVSTVRLPVSQNGTVSLRECEECERQTIRVTPQTTYVIDGKNLRLAEFRKRVAAFKAADGSTNVNVKRDDASNSVASIFIISE